MSFANRITRHPIAHAPDRGAEALAHLHDLAPELRPLIQGTAGCSPYLAGLMAKDGHWLSHALTEPPEDTIATLIKEAGELSLKDLAPGLRQLKRRAALIVALADLGGVWALHTVTQAWTDFADACVQAALHRHVAAEAKRGKIPGVTEDQALADAGGMVALAMGKMGAGELNYSSDIDLICLFDETRFDDADEMEARAGFIRATRKMAAALSDNTAEGYVFRTDLRLRPDASVTPVCISMAAAERYYEAEGRSWERSAYIKARAAAGDIAAGERFLDTLTPFVWRRHLDFAMVQDTMDMRRRIREHKGLHRGSGAIVLEGHNMKLGAGGIREIEFFAQTRQLVAGGRDDSLRQRRTVKALQALARAGWIEGAAAGDLAKLYVQHREIEHRLQMIDDAQTHSLPKSAEGFDRLARFCGEADTEAFRDQLSARLEQTEEICGAFFAPTGREKADGPSEISQEAAEIVARWPGYAALRSVRGQEIFERLKPGFLARFGKAAKPLEALQNFDGFLRGLPAGVQLFSLFEANPPLVDLIVDICATAPGLSQYLSRHSAVLDAVLDGRFFAPWPGRAELVADLGAALEGLDYEDRLDETRRWQKEWHFRTGVHQLRGMIDAETAGAHYTDLADAVLIALWPAVCDEIARRHGPAPGRGGAVVAMGSLGSGRMTAASDLDLIVIYDAGGVEMTEGRRPLDARGWFAKATKALVTALSAPTAAGKLYDVDMRLRPSGRQGPVATALSAFDRYQREEAWTWEHMALTRARAVAGEASLQADIETIRAAVIQDKADAARVLPDAAEMRARLAAAGRKGGTWQVKDGPGGMQDIELVSQAAALIAGVPLRPVSDQIRAGAEIGWLSQGAADTLCAGHLLFATVNQSMRLVTDDAFDPDQVGAGARAFVSEQAGMPDAAALAGQLDSLRASAVSVIDAALECHDSDRITAKAAPHADPTD
ncbi:Glutamate-ammonia-ligase adenylyltransferase [Roseibacterium elongatum DSM 19469]|uniref:Glutamate-ammonia-ligase adenylyltransferase n=1 Tax=Roseicyclus elongatus DSM 19469 TaxID=1294273 RepID=W8S7V9_9RHOB|nr:bifunctional [glutamine synthetase] adenylyltransferase/[glutamine synthetase]-adenylyl-L-tyrosine phosphorylase [Roseibacterium elongatum]AHM05011.1 Glutamate-ammonia-ligase adenylyltransferase [Roseibacterium elongatum DSM 19469]